MTMTLSPTMHLSIPGTVTNRAAPTTDDLMAKIKARQPAGATELDAERVFAWTATISNDTIDSFFTRMHETTLRNYAADLRVGVGWLDSHNVYRVPVGTSIDGSYSAGDPATVTGTFFLIRGTSSGGSAVSADDLAALIEGGIARDCSVGFSPGSFRCNLCDGDPFNWATGSCQHIPGLKYSGEKYKQIAADGSGKLAYAWVIDGRLREVSSVYKGATGGAAVTGVLPLAQEKAARMLGAGDLDRRLEPVLARMLGAPPAANDLELRRLRNDLHTYRSPGGF
jgi:hypothetical protein